MLRMRFWPCRIITKGGRREQKRRRGRGRRELDVSLLLSLKRTYHDGETDESDISTEEL